MPDSNAPNSEKPETPKKKLTLDLDALTPEKVPVQTSLGTVYVGAYRLRLTSLQTDREENVGRIVVQHACSRAEDKNDITPLSDEDIAALSGEDIAMLGPAIAKLQRWPVEDKTEDFASIGRAANRALERESKLLQAEMEKMRDSLKSSFDFLSQSTLRKLQDGMTDMSAIRKLAESASPSSMMSKTVEDLRRKQHFGILEAIRDAGNDREGATASISASRNGPTHPVEPSILSLPTFRPEDSPLGRAALKNAENSEQAVALMRELTQRMAGVQETLVREVLPQWIAQVEREQVSTKAGIAEAAKNTANAAASLRWAKWGIAFSIAVAVGATWWQVRVARQIDGGNTEQLHRAERLLQEQLAAQRQALEQQRAESQKLFDVLQKGLERRERPASTAASRKRSNAS